MPHLAHNKVPLRGVLLQAWREIPLAFSVGQWRAKYQPAMPHLAHNKVPLRGVLLKSWRAIRPMRFMRNGVLGRVCVHVIAMIAWIVSGGVVAQTIGDEAEMERLQNRAEEAIANGDADGAAMNSGKAALMASQLAARQQDQTVTRFYRGAEALFRAQEHAYRALALFQRAGGQPPASSGVCGTMRLARHSLRHALELLADQPPPLVESGRAQRGRRFQAGAEEWEKTLEGLNGDFQCRSEAR